MGREMGIKLFCIEVFRNDFHKSRDLFLPALRLQEQNITWFKSVKYLEMYFDQGLTWRDQVSSLKTRFSKPPAFYYKEISSHYGISLDERKVQTSFRYSFGGSQNFKKQCEKNPNFGVANNGWRNWWSDVIKATIKGSFEGNVNSSTLSTISDHLIGFYTTSKPYEIVPEFLPLATSLSEKGIIVGALSNTDERLKDVLLDLGILHCFQFVLTSYQARVLKPHPLIFKSALEKCIYQVHPSEALHIGDNLYLDYIGAKKANWNSILIATDYLKQCDKAGVEVDPQFMKSSLSHLSDLLLEINSASENYH